MKFTYKLCINNNMPFLDVMVKGNTDGYETSTHNKPTDLVWCLHANSEYLPALQNWSHQRYVSLSIQGYFKLAYLRHRNSMLSRPLSTKDTRTPTLTELESFIQNKLTVSETQHTRYITATRCQQHTRQKQLLWDIILRNINHTA